MKSIRWKFILVTTLALGLIQGVSGYLGQVKLEKELNANLDDKASKTLSLLAKIGSVPLGEFDLPTLEIYIEESMKDKEVLHAAYFDTDDAQVTTMEPVDVKDLATRKFEKEIVSEERDGEVVGKVVVLYSLEKMNAKLASKIQENFVGSAVLFFAISILLFGLFSGIVNKRVKVLLESISAIGKGDFSHTSPELPGDELGLMGAAMNQTSKNLKGLMTEIEEKSVELAHMNANLENIVEERTATINMILTNVNSGFMLIDREFQVREGFTRSCYELFSREFKAGMSFTDALEIGNEKTVSHIRLCLDQVFENFLPEDVTLSQMPERYTLRDGRTLGLSGSAIYDQSGEIEFILYTINDVTSLVEAENENQLNRSIIRIMNRRDAFARFILESKSMIEDGLGGSEDNQSKLRAIMHTLKGNAGVFGLTAIAHNIQIMEDEKSITHQHLRVVEKDLKAFLNQHRQVLKMTYEDEGAIESFELEAAQLRELKHTLVALQSPEEIRGSVLSWIHQIKQKPADQVFGTLTEYVGTVSEKLCKSVDFTFEGKDTLVDPDALAEVSSILPHLVKNAIDHGFESMAERGDKPEAGQLKFSVSDQDADSWSIVLADDGRGIDPVRVAAKAVESGMVTEQEAAQMSKSEKQYLIFKDSFSTATEVTEVSGRGVGMAAVLDTIEAAGGTLEVSSIVGEGTKMTIKIPRKQLPDHESMESPASGRDCATEAGQIKTPAQVTSKSHSVA